MKDCQGRGCLVPPRSNDTQQRAAPKRVLLRASQPMQLLQVLQVAAPQRPCLCLSA